VRPAPVLALALALAACRGPGQAGVAADAGAPASPAFAGLTLDITPSADHDEVSVEVRVSGERAAALREITVARRWADTRGAEALWDPHARDALGEIALDPSPADGGPDDVYRLARAPVGGELTLRYRARGGGPSRFALRVGSDRMSGVGHAFLMLPRIDERVPARIRIHVDALGRGADAASSFGFGREVVTAANSEELAHAVYLAGMLWRERDPEGAEMWVLGNPPLDTRRALDHALAARAAVDRLFAAPEPDHEPFTFVLVAQPGRGRGHEGASLTRSLGVWFDAAQALDGTLDLIVAHELTHRFVGGAVRLVGPDGREAVWFSEGFTVHFARRALLEAGLLAPADYVADIRRTLGGAGDERLPAEYRRGALHAALLDAALRRASQGRRSLDDIGRALVTAGRASPDGSLPVSALRDAIARELGPAGAAQVDRLIAGEDAPHDLPEDTFGPCARRVRHRPTGSAPEITWEAAACPVPSRAPGRSAGGEAAPRRR
jgi:predicted metalloprotease with PDZ domain